MWQERFKEKRLSYGVSQQKLATEAGITRTYLSLIESGKKVPADELKEKLELTLSRFDPESPLTMLFDYVRIRFPTTDVRHVADDVLQLQLKYMVFQEHGFYSYPCHYYYGDIFLCACIPGQEDEEKGTLLELKGRGCRQFERLLLAQGRTWFDFFSLVLNEQAIFKRLDLAINDRVGILSIPEMTEKCGTDECFSVFRSFKSYRSGELIKAQEQDKTTMGNTLYIGSMRSEVYFCVYQKDYEQYIKNGIPLEEAEVKNRFEIRLKSKRAEMAVLDLLRYQDADRTAFSIINRYVRFVDAVPGEKRDNWEINQRWAWFLGKNRKKLRLTTEPEPFTIDRLLRWFQHQVAPSWKMVQIMDDTTGQDTLKQIVDGAKLDKKHETILSQVLTNIQELTARAEMGKGDDKTVVYAGAQGSLSEVFYDELERDGLE